MKKLKDFIYDCNDIVIALVIVAIAGSIILWRVQGIMAYSSYLESKEVKEEIDIDFSDIDLNPIEDNPLEDENPENPPEEDDEPVVPEVKPSPDRNFISAEEVTVVVAKGSGCETIGRAVATAYGFVNDDHKSFVLAFKEIAEELKLETKMHYGTFKIPADSTIEDIIKKLAYIN